MKLPEQFIERTKELIGNDWRLFNESLRENVPVSIRTNPSKGKIQLKAEKVPWCNSACYLDKRPAFTFDPLFHAGCYYPQEASSMFVEQVVKQYVNEDVCVLDLCAAPGGKSTHLLSLLTKNSLLVSNEVIRSRANILSENIVKWGCPNVIVTNNDPSEIGQLEGYFDVILVDAPCSGEGMFRKDKRAIEEWSEANVQLCKERQQRILADIWTALKPNGVLIYSTCTYNTAENEENIQWVCNTLGAEPLNIEVSKEWNITNALKGNLPTYRFLPHQTKGEGFFLAAVRKSKMETGVQINKYRHRKGDKQKKIQLENVYRNYVKDAESYSFIESDGKWTAIPYTFIDNYNYLSSFLRIISAGVEIGGQKGKDFIPSHSLAMSIQFNHDVFPSIEVDWKTAISYLRKESIVLSVEAPKGYILLTYCHVPLGFVKNIGNRANNLYPQEWRIRSGNVPEYFEF